jgi:hypothetical protein
VTARLQIHPVDRQQYEAAEDQCRAHDPKGHVAVAIQKILNEAIAKRTHYCCWQKGKQYPDHKPRSCPTGEHVEREIPQPRKIDRQQR